MQNHSMITFLILFIISFISFECPSAAALGEGTLLGGWKPIPNVTDPAIVDIGKFAIDEHNNNSQASLEFRKVVRGQSQVVAGMNYNLTIAALDGDDHVENNYVAIVWIKPWEQFRRLVSFNGPI
ncbi:cystatin [Artemisia annua]|uniref:Cystatin n=1 Tax=Artemisia annua TaxID=35608 RepID=A0A2U1L8K8_ARTAN|nr:cystatin [Artemisia annua]